MQDQEAWEVWFRHRIEARDSAPWVELLQEGKGQRLEVRMARSRFDLDGDGKLDAVLAYRIALPCDPETSWHAGYRLFVLDETKQRVVPAYFDSALKRLRFIPVLYRLDGKGKGPTRTVFFETGSTGHILNRTLQGMALWIDNDATDQHVGLSNACGISVNHLHRGSATK
jgi:hypothetical protein